jgi:hypothetical protein
MTGSSGTSPHSGQQDSARLVSGPSPPESQRLEVSRRRARRPWRVSRDPRARRYSRTVLRDRRRPRAIARIECCCPASSQSCFTVGRPSMDTSQGVMSPREAPTARGGSVFDRRCWVSFHRRCGWQVLPRDDPHLRFFETQQGNGIERPGIERRAWYRAQDWVVFVVVAGDTRCTTAWRSRASGFREDAKTWVLVTRKVLDVLRCPWEAMRGSGHGPELCDERESGHDPAGAPELGCVWRLVISAQDRRSEHRDRLSRQRQDNASSLGS